jgi:isopenicillin-N epimerase
MASSHPDWSLAAGVTYLNHGSFGLSPSVVREARKGFLKRLEENPMDFYVRELPSALDAATKAMANFVNCSPENLVLMPNATTAMNVVARNTPLTPGDEVLLNNHEYGAVVRIWGKACQEVGAKTVLARLPHPLRSPEDVIEAIFEKVTSRTRLLVVSHVTSPTALVFPIQEICRRAHERNLPVCIDGPHAPAMVPVDLQSLDCDFYTASCHKWLSASFGSGFLYVRPRRKQGLKPSNISWGRSLDGSATSWKDEFHWPGTGDPTPLLSIPVALRFLKEYGLQRFRDETHALAVYARDRLINDVGAVPVALDEPASPDTSWFGSMVSLELPIESHRDSPGMSHPLQKWLWERHQIEVPVMSWREKTLLRVSTHLYNSIEDIDKLVQAVQDWQVGLKSSSQPA